MTKLAVLHLSDMHVKSDRDLCLDFAGVIAGKCYEHVRSADGVLIVVTGDVAYSGQEDQYKIVGGFLSILAENLEKESGKNVSIAMVPGNHDCQLLPEKTSRGVLIRSIMDSPALANDEEMVQQCSSVQDAFMRFHEKFARPEANYSSRLFWQQLIEIDGHKILVSSLNAAWMSQLRERQGGMVYPVQRFDRELSGEASLHLALVHHPFNWYEQESYQQLRKRLRLSCTAIFSGHEHEVNIGKIDEQITGSSLFFESAALQPHGAGQVAGFGIYKFDLDKKEVESVSIEVQSSSMAAESDRRVLTWSNTSLVHSSLDLQDEFTVMLNDPGGNFTHAAKERLVLDDIFVWPDLRDWDGLDSSKQNTRSSKDLVEDVVNGRRQAIYGEDKSGKTTLLYKIFSELRELGLVPVYFSSGEYVIKNVDDAGRKVFQAISKAYKNTDYVNSVSKDKRVLLVDDIDRLKGGGRAQAYLMEYAELHFGGICITASREFEITNLASKEASAALQSFVSMDLLKFGLKLRHQLIKKWCSISSVATLPELDRRVDEVESIINTVIGKQLIPEYPLYLLILLQSTEQHRHGEIQNSGLSFYYQYLITKSLGEVGVKPVELDEHFNYLSLVAWELKRSGQKEIERNDFSLINDNFSRKFVTVDLAERLSLLVRARLLTRRGDYYSFTYPYVYYFFIGRYLAKNIDQPEIKDWIEDSCKKLYIRDRALAVMFLTHHAENRWVISLICNVLRECFADKQPIELNGDTAFLNELVEKTGQLILPTPNVEENQAAVREFEDRIPEREVEEDYDVLSFPSKWNLLTKTAEILGVILKNYYGSLERSQKQEMIVEVFDGPLRALRLWLEEVAATLPDFVENLRQAELDIDPEMSRAEAEARVKRRLFRIMGLVATGVIASVGGYVASDKLKEDVSAVVKSKQTNAYMLIEAATRLLKPGHIPIDKIKKLARDLERNPYAFGVLQSLGFYHLYMYHTEEPVKQALAATLKISFKASKSIEVNRQRGKQLK